MIIITGAAGFIGSCMVAYLNEKGFNDLILVDDFSRKDKMPNWQNKRYTAIIQRQEFPNWLPQLQKKTQIIVHLGARTDTTEKNTEIFDSLNLNYSKALWHLCTEYQIPFLYASSAATYGDGTQGFSDERSPSTLAPLNPYGKSKNDFDDFVLKQAETPYFWAGFKFFNVYGPNEYHKGRMASVIWHAFNQIQQNKHYKLFQSHRPDYAHGEQKRDFIYVKDICNILFYFMETRKHSGIYNAGTGKAESFNTLARALFETLDLAPQIEYIPTPEDIRDTYQYYTQADIQKLRNAGYTQNFHNLNDGISDYVQNYLLPNKSM